MNDLLQKKAKVLWNAWKHGGKMTAQKRLAQYPTDMEEHSDVMWCKHCDVDWKEESFASKYFVSGAHKDAKKRLKGGRRVVAYSVKL